MTITARPSRPESSSADVLLVHRGGAEAARLGDVLGERGLSVSLVEDASAAIDLLVRARFDVLLVDGDLDERASLELTRVVRAYDIEVPIVVLTGDARGWVGAGVQIVGKPVDPAALTRTVERAKEQRHTTRRMRVSHLAMAAQATAPAQEKVDVLFERALEQLWLAFQPIVHPGAAQVFAYEALMRSREPKLASPGAVLGAAEALGRLDDLGRKVRELAGFALSRAPDGVLLFVNLHARDLLDQALYDFRGDLANLARRVVLEITERANIEDIADIGARLSVLRFHGFRVAVDDLGAGYAGLTSFATIEPEFVKLDMSLVRNVHASPVRRRLVVSMVEACHDLGSRVVAEGIESREELAALREVGCDLFQGFLISRPSPLFDVPAPL